MTNQSSYGKAKLGFRKGLFSEWGRYMIGSWMTAAAIEYLILPKELRGLSGLEGLAHMSFGRVLALTLAFTVLWRIAAVFWDTTKWSRWAITAGYALLAGACVRESYSGAFFIASLLILGILAVYSSLGWDNSPLPSPVVYKEKRRYAMITGLGAVLLFLLVSLWTVGRVWSFSTPTYDFGIFSQMFYYMKTTGLPLTTLERDGLLSHFQVHVSPIYYLILPVFCLAPYPETLQVCQAAVLASSVVPLWKLGKRHGLKAGERMAVCFLLLLYPAFSGGTGYDIHENCFLTPLLLWLLYGIDEKKGMTTFLAAVLTLMVKEDAPVYVAVIGLWLLVRSLLHASGRRDLYTGGALLMGAVLWFVLAVSYLNRAGDGAMTYRYRNFMFDGSGSLVTVIKAVIMNPIKALYECVDREKLSFIALTMGPLLGLPLITRRYERYLLLIPYVLVNLMSDYTYQHNIFFQYCFGSIACLLYLVTVNLADWKQGRRRKIALFIALIVSVLCFGKTILPKAWDYTTRYLRYESYYSQVRTQLSQIPEEASVAASTFYTTCLSQREVLYDVKYASREHLLECAYVAVDKRGDFEKYADADGKNGFENFNRFLDENGYTHYASVGNSLVIYYRASG